MIRYHASEFCRDARSAPMTSPLFIERNDPSPLSIAVCYAPPRAATSLRHAAGAAATMSSVMCLSVTRSGFTLPRRRRCRYVPSRRKQKIAMPRNALTAPRQQSRRCHAPRAPMIAFARSACRCADGARRRLMMLCAERRARRVQYGA